MTGKNDDNDILLALGNDAYVNELYSSAIKNYSNAISNEEGSVNTTNMTLLSKAYGNRSAAYFKTKCYKQCYTDACKSLDLSSKNKSVLLLRKGMSAFQCDRYQEALEAFESIVSTTTTTNDSDDEEDVDRITKQASTWIRKCKAEIPSTSPPTTTTANTTVPVTTSAPVVKSNNIKWDWYQTNTHVVITLMIKKLSRDDIDLKVLNNQHKSFLSLSVKSYGTLFDSSQLFSTVSDEEFIKVYGTKVEVRLKKMEEFQWPSLEEDSSSDELSSIPSTSTSVPRPYASKKDWNAIDSSLKSELEAEKPEGEAAMQKLFSDIFKNASDDTRRAMNKSFQTSGGTVLSTNWDEVSTKDYEKEKPVPDGMEWKKYE